MEEEFAEAARLMGAGAVAGLEGEIALLAGRTKQPHLHEYQGHARQQIDQSLSEALQEGKLELKLQRIKRKTTVDRSLIRGLIP